MLDARLAKTKLTWCALCKSLRATIVDRNDVAEKIEEMIRNKAMIRAAKRKNNNGAEDRKDMPLSKKQKFERPVRKCRQSLRSDGSAESEESRSDGSAEPEESGSDESTEPEESLDSDYSEGINFCMH